ncbi:hypothetical protein KJ359_000168 [Pestalotiopsis sp. 9143b]|nr:hypothetical protein KJ359_000168 [Pestalotiopsis sp. 9143b]
MFCTMARHISSCTDGTTLFGLGILFILVLAADIAANIYAAWLVKSNLQPYLATLNPTVPCQPTPTNSSRSPTSSDVVFLYFVGTALIGAMALFYASLSMLFGTSRITEGKDDEESAKVMSLIASVGTHVSLSAISLHYTLDWQQNSVTAEGEWDLVYTFAWLKGVLSADIVIGGCLFITIVLFECLMFYLSKPHAPTPRTPPPRHDFHNHAEQP